MLFFGLINNISLAWFHVLITGEGNNKVMTSEELKLTYVDAQNFTLDNMVPGDSESKHFILQILENLIYH